MQDKKNFYINGEWVSPLESRIFQVINPATEEPCAEISLGGKKDVDVAVEAAKKAFETWGFVSKEEKLLLFEKQNVTRMICKRLQLRNKPSVNKLKNFINTYKNPNNIFCRFIVNRLLLC